MLGSKRTAAEPPSPPLPRRPSWLLRPRRAPAPLRPEVTVMIGGSAPHQTLIYMMNCPLQPSTGQNPINLPVSTSSRVLSTRDKYASGQSAQGRTSPSRPPGAWRKTVKHRFWAGLRGPEKSSTSAGRGHFSCKCGTSDMGRRGARDGPSNRPKVFRETPRLLAEHWLALLEPLFEESWSVCCPCAPQSTKIHLGQQ